MVAKAGVADALAATMTGELADCFATKQDGVRHIVCALGEVAANRPLWIYLTDGRFVTPAEALDRPLAAAASNWHALATVAAKLVNCSPALLIDIGSTTTDLIPIWDGRVQARGLTDPDRLATDELVYTGVRRSPVCALVDQLPWQGRSCRVAQELFATTGDAYLVLGELPEEPQSLETADGRPATRHCAAARLARMVCADSSMFDWHDAQRAAEAIVQEQYRLLVSAAEHVLQSMSRAPTAVAISGAGEFLARKIAAAVAPSAEILSLTERWGATVSAVAPAHAVALLANESCR
jgi:probable H4MPT-linked C1 transfer pathway protein